MLKERLITGIILILLAIYLIFRATPLVFTCVIGLVVLLAGWEWSGLMRVQKTVYRLGYLLIISLGMIAVFYLPIFYILSAVFCWWLVALFLIFQYPKAKKWWASGFLVRAMMGLFVLIPFWYALTFFIRATMDGRWLLFFLMILISGADVGAYFSGRTWGDKKLLPSVSPNKTRVGLLGGLLLGLGLAFVGILSFPVYCLTNMSPVQILSLLGVSFVTILFSVAGDFFESMLKREVGLKDSGAIFPGHGGILDRIDSLTAAAPVFLFGLLLINMKI